MAVIGNSPATTGATTTAQSFNGDASTVAFILSRSVNSTVDLEVLVDNVQQSPYDGSYSVSGTTLTFSEAPASGTNNVYVIYRGATIQTAQVVPDDGSVTNAKMASNAALNNLASGGTQFGRRNIIINGAMQVAQRGTSHTLSSGVGSYTLDRVRSQSNGGGITVSQETNAISGINTQKMCRYTGASGVTGVYYIYRVESKDVAQINGNSVTFSIYVENNSGSSINPTIDYYHPTATDNFSGNTTITSGVSLGTVANGSSARLTATTDLSGTTITNGLMLQISFGSALTSGTIDFTGVQLEVGTVATPFEHRSYGEELVLCQRYYQDLGPTAANYGAVGQARSLTNADIILKLHGPMRADPTGSYDDIDAIRCTNATVNSVPNVTAVVFYTAGGAKSGYVRMYITASGLVAGNAVMLLPYNGVLLAKLMFDAEL